MAMTFRTPLFAAAALLGALLLPQNAFAFCGVMQASAQSMSGQQAAAMADYRVNKQIKKLKRQYRSKLVLDQKTAECVGGALAIDTNGNQIVGP
jgi:hypothetical protein